MAVTEERPGKSLRWLDSALWVLFATAWAYALAFAYETGYLIHFGIPSDFAEVDLRSLLIGAASMLATVFFIYTTTSIFVPNLPRRVSPQLQEDFALVVWCSIGIGLLGTLTHWGYALIGLALPPAAFLTTVLIVPIFRHGSGYWAKLEAAAKARHSRESDETSVLDAAGSMRELRAVIKWLGLPTMWILAVALISAYVAHYVGYLDADHQEVFLVSAKEKCVVVRVRTDGLLCATLDLTNPRRLQGEYHFLKPETAALRLTYAGPLDPPYATGLPAVVNLHAGAANATEQHGDPGKPRGPAPQVQAESEVQAESKPDAR